MASIFATFFSFHFCFSLLILSLSLYCLSSFLIIDALAAKHPRLEFGADLSNNDSLIHNNGTGSVEAVAVAVPAGIRICTAAISICQKSKFCELNAD